MLRIVVAAFILQLPFLIGISWNIAFSFLPGRRTGISRINPGESMYLKSQTIRKPNGKSYTYFRLVEAYREGGKVKHRILAELGSLTPAEAAKLARRFAGIAGLEISDAGDVVEVNGSKYFGAPLLVEQLVEILFLY